MKSDKCPDCGETDCAWKWYADREKEFSGKLRDDLQDDFNDIDPVLKAEVINIYFEQAEQIGLLKTENAALKHFADQKEAKNQRLKELLVKTHDTIFSEVKGSYTTTLWKIIDEIKHEISKPTLAAQPQKESER